jgi:hypothetical protein
MSYTQAITPNPNIPCKPGWCLQYVRQTFGLPAIHPTATAAWEASKTQHRDHNFPSNVWFAVWFALANEPAGHVALMSPDGTVYSTSDLGNTPHRHPDLTDLHNYYARYGMPLTYLGWTEDVQGIPVITNQGLAAMGDTITPQEDELSAQDVERIINEINTANEAKHAATRKIAQEAINAARDSVNFNTQKQVEAVGRVTQQLIIDNASPAEIAASIPAGIAQAVADELAKRLVK